MASIIYQKPSDQKASGAATVTPSTEDANFPKANLYDTNPAKPFKFTATTGNIVWDMGAPQQLDLVAILHHNLTAGLANVKIQGNAADSWGAPSLDQAITIPAYAEDGYPVSPWVDLTGIGSRTFRYWRLHFGTANGANIALGEVWLGAMKRSLVHNIAWGFSEGQTRWKTRVIEGEVQTTDAGATALRDLWRASRPRTSMPPIAHRTDYGVRLTNDKPFLIVLDPAVNDAMLVHFPEDFDLRITRQFTDNNQVPLAFEELSRGMTL